MEANPGRLENLPESSLLRLAKTGSPKDAAAASGILYDRTIDPLCFFLAAKGLTRPETESAIQETWARALDALPLYEVRGIPFIAWLKRIGENVCHEMVRDRFRTYPLPEGYDAAAGDEQSRDPAETFSEAEQQTNLRAALDEVLATLTPDQKTAVEQRLVIGRSTRDVASQLGWSTTKVDTTLHRARAAFRDRMITRFGLTQTAQWLGIAESALASLQTKGLLGPERGSR